MFPLIKMTASAFMFNIFHFSPITSIFFSLWIGAFLVMPFYVFLKALDGFFIVMLTDGNIIYISESVTSLLEHLPVSERGCVFSWQIVCSLFKDLELLHFISVICSYIIMFVSVGPGGSEPFKLSTSGGA